MVRVCCSTALDDFKRCEWPKELQVLPQIGEHVREERGYRRLKVISIEHSKNVIYLELHK